ncbi:hypothetical protein [Oceanobacillus sp. 1P07AA]|uniref:hypothetical protein n=1 Tax=Oceanobacillus sp. 1P07AA TaxID=3132293 RepID=UPI0039A6447C
MNNNGLHCLFFVLKEVISSQGIKLSESDLLLLSGGFKFKYEIEGIEGDETPRSFKIYGGEAEYSKIKQNSNILITPQKLNSKKIINDLIVLLENNITPIVYTNCFYLRFDKKNFNRNSDKHYIILNKYIPERKEFLISDYNFKTKIQSDDLLKAMRDQKYKFLNINVTNHLSREVIIDNIFKEWQNFANSFMDTTFHNLLQFQNDIIKLLHIEYNLSRELSIYGLSKSLKHPRGPIISRKLISSNPFLSSECRNLYYELYKMWNHFSNELLRHAYQKSSIEEVLLIYSKIFEKEIKAASIT